MELLALVALVASAVAGCGSSTTKAASLLPAPLPPGAPPGQFALHVLHGPDHATLLVAGVRIDGEGPYPFLVDTGSAFSDITPQLSSRLRLPAAPPMSGGQGGAVCAKNQASSATTPRVKIGDWEVGGVRLPATAAVTAPAVNGLGSGLAGRIGSDVLSKLSPLTADYHASRGSLGVPISTAAGQQVPVKVISVQGQVLVGAPATVSGHRYPVIVDTGASRTTVSHMLSDQVNLPVVQKGVRISGITCSTKTNVVAVNNWSVGPAAMPVAKAFVSTLPGGVQALIGGDVLSSFGTVTIDYTHQVLRLGS